jgi:hypothetical protein
MEGLNSELSRVIRHLDLAQESKILIVKILAGEGKAIAASRALKVIWLADSLKKGRFQALITLEKKHLLENLLSRLRQGGIGWVSSICNILYEGALPPVGVSSPFPRAMIRDLLNGVNMEKGESVREIFWAILLRKEIGLASFAGVADLAAGLCEKDPMTRNNIISFLLDHFAPAQVVDALFQYSVASGKRIPCTAFKRYVGLLKDKVDPRQKKQILERILRSVRLEEKEIDQIFTEYVNTLNRFDLVRLSSSCPGSRLRIEQLRPKSAQMELPLDHHKTCSPYNVSFRQRISSLMQGPT